MNRLENTRWRRVLVRLVMAFGIVSLAQPDASAADFKWKGNGGTVGNPKGGNWNVAGNWENAAGMAGIPPSNAATALIFKTGTAEGNQATYGSIIDITNPFRLNSLTFQDGGGPAPAKITSKNGEVLEFTLNGNATPFIAVNGGRYVLNPQRINIDAAKLSVSGSGVIGETGATSAAITGDGGLELESGSLVFSGKAANSYAGPTKVIGGFLELNKVGIKDSTIPGNMTAQSDVFWHADYQVANGATVTVEYNGILTLNDKKEDFAFLAGTTGGTVILGGGELKLDGLPLNQAQNSSYVGRLWADVGGKLLKRNKDYKFSYFGDGEGFKGTVEVDGGTMVLGAGGVLGKNEDNQRCNQVLVKGGATLEGNGIINCKPEGPGTIGKGLKILPAAKAKPKGNSPGILHALEAEFDPGSFLEIEIDGTLPGDGPGYHSQLHIFGDYIDISQSMLQLVLDSPPVLDNDYMILRNDGPSWIIGNFAGLSGNGSFLTVDYGLNTYYFRINYNGGDGNDIVLTNVKTPEPATGLILAVGGVAMRRRRGVKQRRRPAARAGDPARSRCSDGLAAPCRWIQTSSAP